MRRTATAATAALLTVLLAGGCSDGTGGGGGKADSSPAPASSAPAAGAETAAAAPRLSEEWGTKLQAATRSSQDDVCKTVGSKPCVDHITTLTELVYDVRDAIDTAGQAAAYPKTLAAVDDVEEASGAYAEGGCAGSSEATLLDGSECGGYVATLLLGPSMLDIRMTTDELAAP
ncbi:hypothetical protein ADL27_55020 [Streptomyces sp. NRRL F-6602]|nr:hypothetical protein ADL27_55020 [Streptomyces sp. NRRL F-6602]